MLLDCFAISCIYGLSPILEKHLIQFISIETTIILFGFFYFLFSSVLFYFYGNTIRRDIAILNKNKHLYLEILVSTFLVFVVANFLYLRLIKHHTTYLGVGMTSVYPIITLLAGYVFLNETFTYVHLCGLFTIILGVVLLGH
jgi:drug/metabolite transporter (DMT)-like permease